MNRWHRGLLIGALCFCFVGGLCCLIGTARAAETEQDIKVMLKAYIGDLNTKTSAEKHLSSEPSAIKLVDDRHAVVRTRCDASHPVMDAYIFLNRSEKDEWKVVGIKTFGPVVLMNLALEEKAGKSGRNSPHDSKETSLLRLAVSPDEALISWFSRNRAVLESVEKVAEKELRDDKGPSIIGDANKEQSPAMKRALSSSSLCACAVARGPGDTIRLIIGGILRVEVGFLYTRADKPPQMGEGTDYLWVEKVADNWYLYRKG